MDMGRFLVETHLRTGRPIAELARTHGVERSWIYRLLARYRRRGRGRSRAPRPAAAALAHPDRRSVRGRDRGAPQGARRRRRRCGGRDHPTSTWSATRSTPPSVSTIWRVLKARGFVTPQPHKRPKSSYIRFVADLPNECWQADVTHVELADG